MGDEVSGSGNGKGGLADNTSLEYPLQRDEVQSTTQQKNNHVPKGEYHCLCYLLCPLFNQSMSSPCSLVQ